MPDSSIARTINLPNAPVLTGDLNNDIASVYGYFSDFRNAVAAAYDDITARINQFNVFLEWGDTVYPQLTANQNDFVLSDGIVHRFSGNAARSILGFEAPVVSRFIVILNDGAFALDLAAEDLGSIAENRISPLTSPFALASGGSCSLWYDTSAKRWRQFAL